MTRGPKVSQLDVARQGIVEDLVRYACSAADIEAHLAKLTEDATLARADLIEARNSLRATANELANHDRRRASS